MDYTRRNVLKGGTALLAAPWLEQAVFPQTSVSTPANSLQDASSYVNPQFRAPLPRFASAPSVDAKQLQMARARTKISG